MEGLHYHRAGAGAPLVLLHGIGHHWGAWELVLDRLAEHYDVIAIDLPGFGESEVPAEGVPSDMDGWVAVLAEIFADLGLERPHVVGNSLGGAVALELAAAGHARTVTALAPAGFTTPWQLRWALGVLGLHRMVSRLPARLVYGAAANRPLRTLAYRLITAHPERVSADTAKADATGMRRARAFAAVARLGRRYEFHREPTVPTTVAWGKRDRILFYRESIVARQRLPRAVHLSLPDCGHLPMADNPRLVADLILATASRG